MERIRRIAIDGPGGAGKSTIARLVAKRLRMDYIDTGAMYRAVGYKLLKENISLDDTEAVGEMLDRTDIDFSEGHIFLDGEMADDLIRTPEISAQASNCSAIGIVREKLTEIQREMGKRKSVVMEGRDIGTVVLPDAEYKFYLVASPEVRAKRRQRELAEKGRNVPYDRVLSDMEKRDLCDTERKISPLKKAPDAVEVDTTHMGIEETVDLICGRIK